MTDESRDHTTEPGWTRADTDALFDAALIRDGWYEDVAFAPIEPTTLEDLADPQVGRTITRAQLDRLFDEVFTFGGRYQRP